MAAHYGLGMMCYSPLAGGLLTAKYRQGLSGRLTKPDSDYDEDERTKSIIDALEQIGKQLHVTPGQVALAWVINQGAFPIIGARTLSHLEMSLKVLDIKLDTEQMSRLNNVSAISMGYPHELLSTVQKKY